MCGKKLLRFTIERQILISERQFCFISSFFISISSDKNNPCNSGNVTAFEKVHAIRSSHKEILSGSQWAFNARSPTVITWQLIENARQGNHPQRSDGVPPRVEGRGEHSSRSAAKRERGREKESGRRGINAGGSERQRKGARETGKEGQWIKFLRPWGRHIRRHSSRPPPGGPCESFNGNFPLAKGTPPPRGSPLGDYKFSRPRDVTSGCGSSPEDLVSCLKNGILKAGVKSEYPVLQFSR